MKIFFPQKYTETGDEPSLL